MVITTVNIRPKVKKQLKKLDLNIVEQVLKWVDKVEKDGLVKTRTVKGYNDKSLKGDREGQRSVRLNKAYRLFYREVNGVVEIEVIEVNNHEY